MPLVKSRCRFMVKGKIFIISGPGCADPAFNYLLQCSMDHPYCAPLAR
jgi:hypothetical protein